MVARFGRELRRALLDLLWPPHCAGCGGPLPQPVEPQSALHREGFTVKGLQ